MIEYAWNVPLWISGPTLVDPRAHALILPPRSHAHSLRVVGWLFNEDGIWVTSNSTVTDCFVRTNDDALRFFGGAVDPPPGAEATMRDLNPASWARVQGLVVHQLFNGAVVQLGWETVGTVGCSVQELTVLSAEWYYRGESTGDNNAILSLQSPLYHKSLTEKHRNFRFSQVVVEGPVGRVLAIALRGSGQDQPEGGCSSFERLLLSDILISRPSAWFPFDQPHVWKQTRSGGFCQPPNACNLLVAGGCDRIHRVRFERVSLNGRCVRSHGDWGLRQLGNVSVPQYDKCLGQTRDSVLGRCTCA